MDHARPQGLEHCRWGDPGRAEEEPDHVAPTGETDPVRDSWAEVVSAGEAFPGSANPGNASTIGGGMRVTVSQLHEDRDRFDHDWKELSAHVREERSDLVLLPEMPFSRWSRISLRLRPRGVGGGASRTRPCLGDAPRPGSCLSRGISPGGARRPTPQRRLRLGTGGRVPNGASQALPARPSGLPIALLVPEHGRSFASFSDLLRSVGSHYCSS